MAIIKAYTLPHPPLAIPGVGSGKEKGIENTLASFDDAAREIADLAPDTIIYITPHSVIYSDYFHVSPGKSAKGDFSKFAAPKVRIETQYDIEFTEKLTMLCGQSGFPAGTLGERDSALDHGVTVPMWFINNRFKEYKAVRISQSGLSSSEHYKLGQIIRQTAENLGRKTILIASSDLSHKLRQDGPYGYAPEGPEFDNCIAQILSKGEFLTLFKIPTELREHAAECGYNSLMVMAGCFDRREVKARLLSYEGPFGVGYAAASFEPGECDEGRDFLDQFTRITLDLASKKRESEDMYRALARQSLEHMVKEGKEFALPDNLPEGLVGKKAGVFVSIHISGQLRGCVGTIAPTTNCIADEIIQNAVSAGLRDNRFEQVTEAELPLLTYKVDVLAEPEVVSGTDELDVRRYGVIISSGYKRGLLLPNLEGIDTVKEQVSIARRKAGISENEKVRIERFEVIRYE